MKHPSKSKIRLYEIHYLTFGETQKLIMECEAIIDEARSLGIEPKLILHPNEIRAMVNFFPHYPSEVQSAYKDTFSECDVIESSIIGTPMVI